MNSWNVMIRNNVLVGLSVFGLSTLYGCGTESSGGTVSFFKPKDKGGEIEETVCNTRRGIINVVWISNPECGPKADSRILGHWDVDEASGQKCRYGMNTAKNPSDIYFRAIDMKSDKSCVLTGTDGIERRCGWSTDWDQRFIVIDIMKPVANSDAWETDYQYRSVGYPYSFTGEKLDHLKTDSPNQCAFVKSE